MASPDQSILPRLEQLTPSPRQPPALTDDALEEIFLRVTSHADLARAATACVSFCRLIADPNFLRRHRSSHPPILLGFLDGKGEVFHPVEVPHPNAPVARAFGSTAGFSFNYLPNNTELRWVLRDVGDGRVLLEVELSPVDDDDDFALPDLKVYDPLLRQYLLLPRIPQDLLASVQIEELDIVDFNVSLVPSGDWEEASFRVLSMIRNSTWLVACVFSSTSGCWSVGASTSLDFPSSIIPLRRMQPQFAYSCCYWEAIHLTDPNKLLKLDMERMEFSAVDLPPDHDRLVWRVAIVEAGEGNLGMFRLIDDEAGGTSVAYYICMQNVSGRANEWHLKNTTPVAHHFCGFVGSAGGYVFLIHRQEYSGSLLPEYVCSSLEIKTSNIERLSRTSSPVRYPYFGFPPFMSPRRI